MLRAIALMGLLTACTSGDDTDDLGEFYVTATVDGEPYEGDSQGARYTQAGTPTELMLWPADELSGYLFGWAAGATGSWTLSSGDTPDAVLYWFDSAMAQHISDTGELSIDTWTLHEPENAADERIGFITGTFHGSFSTLDGGSVVEITDGEFHSMVTSAGR